jgi:hypothetical protein|tara:strand:+ start:683 stop:805 length:123 start_codon:yes stop_codon:yes gene_type:complete
VKHLASDLLAKKCRRPFVLSGKTGHSLFAKVSAEKVLPTN